MGSAVALQIAVVALALRLTKPQVSSGVRRMSLHGAAKTARSAGRVDAHVGLGGDRAAAVADVEAAVHADKPALGCDARRALERQGEAVDGADRDDRHGGRRPLDRVDQGGDAVLVDVPGYLARS